MSLVMILLILAISLMIGLDSIADCCDNTSSTAAVEKVEIKMTENAAMTETTETESEVANETKREDDKIEATVNDFATEETAEAELQKESIPEKSSAEKETEQVQVAVISAYQAGNVYYYHVTDEEKVYMAKLVYAEARGECLEGKVAVAAVILNRYVSGSTWFYRDSIYDVITQPWQFASISGITEQDLMSVPECMEAVEYALKGWDPTRKMFENGACFFYAPDKISASEAAKRAGVPTLTIGNHAFHNDFNTD